MAVGDLDGLFDGHGFNAVPDIFLHYGDRAFNSGVFAFSPSADLRHELFARLPSLSIDDGDQSALNAFFRDWTALPLGYNFLRIYALVRAQAREHGLRILHYTLRRPWSFGPRSPSDYALAPLDDAWAAQITDEEYRAVSYVWTDNAAQIKANMEAWVAEKLGLDTLRRAHRRAGICIAALAVVVIAQALAIALLLAR